MYTARIVATDTINATTFLNYLEMADPISVLLHNGTSFSNEGTSRSCPLSIPSPDDVNCTTLSSANAPVNGTSNINDTSNSDSGGSDNSSDDNDDNGDSIATVIAVAVGCSVGIVAMAIFVMFTMFVCNRCRCHNHDSR